MTNLARVFAYRKSCKPFIVDPTVDLTKGSAVVVAAIVHVEQPIQVSDSIFGKDSYSIQFQCNNDDGQWAQAAFRFNGPTGFNDFVVYEATGSAQEQMVAYSSNGTTNPPPRVTGLDAGYTYSFQIKDDGKTLYGVGSIQDASGNIVWQSGDVAFTSYGHPTNANAVACGFGGGSVATFTAGRFSFQILASPGYNDLAFIQPNPLLGVPFLTPCGPIVTQTVEAENLRYVNVESSGVAVSYEGM